MGRLMRDRVRTCEEEEQKLTRDWSHPSCVVGESFHDGECGGKRQHHKKKDEGRLAPLVLGGMNDDTYTQERKRDSAKEETIHQIMPCISLREVGW